MIPPENLGEFIVDMAALTIIALIYIVYYTYTVKKNKKQK